MVREQLKVNRHYSLKACTVDTVIVNEIFDRFVFFSYIHCDAALFKDNRTLPIVVFMKCYEPNKMCDVLFGEK